MRVVARRIDGFAHEVDLEGGHELVVDEPRDRGGTDTGPRPTQLLAASLAGCTAITVEMYADRKGWDVGQVEVDVDVELRRPGARRTFDGRAEAAGASSTRSSGGGCW